MKRFFLSLWCILCIMFAFNVPVWAEELPVEEYMGETSVLLSSEEKLLFVETVEEKYKSNVKKKKDVDDEKKFELLEELTFAEECDRNSIKEELEEYGVYEFVSSSTTKNESRKVSNSNVYVAIPSVYYDASTTNWIVACSGNWLNDNWNTGGGDIGGADAFGVVYSSIGGTYNTYVVSAYGYLCDQNYSTYTTTYNRSNGEGHNGFGFLLQDYKISNSSYVGYRWYGICMYDSNFANYSGVATGYYEHTYSTCQITSVTYDTMSGNINYGFTNATYSFPAYGNDKQF